MSVAPDRGSVWPWLLAGGASGALALWWWNRRADAAPRNDRVVGAIAAPPDDPPSGGAAGWVFPVPTWRGRRAEISDGFSARAVPGGHRKHLGVDIMFRRRSRDELTIEYPPGSPHGSRWYFVPIGHLAVAAADGDVWFAGRTSRGHQVVLSHGAPWATLYQHLETLLVQPTARGASRERVRAGQPLGVIGGNPELAPHLRHLHFEIWHGGAGDHAIDPRPLLDRWPHIPEPARGVRAEA